MRSFTDEHGVEWTVWETRPNSLSATMSPAHGVPAFPIDRADVADPTAPERESGWLTFESAAEKRRLSPAPADWDSSSEAQLRDLLRSAAAVPKRRLVE